MTTQVTANQAHSTKTAFIQPYVFFGGRCEEALAFYRKTLDAKVEMVLHFNESPEPPPPGQIAPGFEKKVMHAEFRVGSTTILASDGCDDKTPLSGFSLALTVPTELEAKRIFAALAEDGEIKMPLGKTFWSPSYGMLVDRFGVDWMVMVPGEPRK